MSTAVLATVISGAVADPLAAQSFPGPRTDGLRSNIPDLAAAQYVVPIDLDGDGDLDLYVVDRTGFSRPEAPRARGFLNDGTGRFELIASGDASAVFSRPLSVIRQVDFDGDGDRDLLVRWLSRSTRSSPTTWGLRNDGSGVFVEEIFLNGEVLDVADVDGDGAVDLLYHSSSFPRQTEVRFGAFGTAPVSVPLDPSMQLPVFADIDGDGDLDVVGTSVTQRYLGARVFDVANGLAGLPGIPLDGGDLDGDGVDEVLFGPAIGSTLTVLAFSAGAPRIAGIVEADTPRGVGRAERIAQLLDLDGDGLDDIVTVEGRVAYGNAALSLSLTDNIAGGGGFLAVTEDLNGDGSIDCVFSSPSALSLQVAPREFVRAGNSGVAFSTRPAYPEFVELDGDGRRDMVTEHGVSFRSAEGFLETMRLPELEASLGRGVPIGDFDGDGDVDLFTRNGWYRNDGARSFQFVPLFLGLPPDQSFYYADVGDLDADGLLDVVIDRRKAPGVAIREVVWVRSLGGGLFAPPVVLQGVPDPRGRVLLGDLDGDGNLDLVLGGSSLDEIHLAFGDGAGGFPTVVATGIDDDVYELADHDGDGRLDLRGRRGVYLNGPTLPMLTRGPSVRGSSLAIGPIYHYVDVEGDGQVEILTRGDGWDETVIFRQNAVGDWVRSSEPELRLVPEFVTALDLDDDGDLDLTDGANFLPGTFSQLHVPFLGRPGQDLVVELEFLPGVSGAPVQVLMFGSPFAARIPLSSLGVVGLDPGTLIPLGRVTIPPAVGRTEIRERLPNSTALVGVRFYLQALFQPMFLAPRLSNTVPVVVR